MDDENARGVSRRRTLVTGTALFAGLAGCLGGDGGGGSDPTTDDGSTTDATTSEGSDGTGDATTEDGGATGGDETITGDDGGGTTDGTDDGGETTTGDGQADWPEGIESEPLPESGDEGFLSGVETFEIESATHVQSGTAIDYEQMPPVGGPHYSGWVDPGFYERSPPVGALVHNLEHGAVVVYYDPGAATDRATESLRAFAAEHTDPWAHVVVVPTPVEDPAAPYVLTAWGARLRLETYDARAVRAFLAEYVGRGPENPVR